MIPEVHLGRLAGCMASLLLSLGEDALDLERVLGLSVAEFILEFGSHRGIRFTVLDSSDPVVDTVSAEPPAPDPVEPRCWSCEHSRLHGAGSNYPFECDVCAIDGRSGGWFARLTGHERPCLSFKRRVLLCGDCVGFDQTDDVRFEPICRRACGGAIVSEKGAACGDFERLGLVPVKPKK